MGYRLVCCSDKIMAPRIRGEGRLHSGAHSQHHKMY
nr:hypothetical protein I308_04059 [Cryptococcus tetragattii IND107]